MIDKKREIALKALHEISIKEAYSNIALDNIIKINRNKIDERDIGFISELVYGVTTWRLTLDAIINKYSKIKLKKISQWILEILRLGIYQIIFLDKIPKSAAVNESVSLAKRYGHKSSANFVNAILRKVEKNDYEELFKIENDMERISKTSSMPIWIIEELLKNNNIEEVEKICMNSNLRPKTSIRVNNLKTNKQQLIKELSEQNYVVEEGILEDFLILNRTKNIENMEIFKNGLFTIQDEVAGLVSIILNPGKDEKILDACSAPGGKTTYLAEIMKNTGEINAWDIYKHRLKLVEENANRLGIKNIEIQEKDASIYDEVYENEYDKILLDVPCLGIGVLKRKPDIKWKRKKEDIQEITKIQQQILQNCSKYLKKGGKLVYSTCSIINNENENIINKFLEKNKHFRIEKIKLDNNYKFFEKYIQNNGCLQVYQNEETDGFFISLIVKNK